MYPNIPEEAVPVILTPPVTTNGGVTTDYISLKNAHRVFVVCVMKQAATHATGIDPVQATLVDGTGAKAITNTVPIWKNADISATSVMTRQTDAITANATAGTTDKVITFDINPAKLDVENAFDVLGFTVDDSSEATNFISIVAYVIPRYASPAPNFIVD